jgi:very-short-patch-repair endonuclease
VTPTKNRMTAEEFRNSGLQIRTSDTGRKDYKVELLRQIKEAELPAPQTEVVFHPTRKWRFDFLFVEYAVAVEYDGGVFSGEASHSSVSGILRDIEKINEATLAGFTVLRVTAQTVESGAALRYIKRAINRAKRATIPEEGGKLAHVKRQLQTVLSDLDK